MTCVKILQGRILLFLWQLKNGCYVAKFLLTSTVLSEKRTSANLQNVVCSNVAVTCNAWKRNWQGIAPIIGCKIRIFVCFNEWVIESGSISLSHLYHWISTYNYRARYNKFDWIITVKVRYLNQSVCRIYRPCLKLYAVPSEFSVILLDVWQERVDEFVKMVKFFIAFFNDYIRVPRGHKLR